MTFKVRENPTFPWKVTFHWAENNRLVPHTFTAIFKRKRTKELAEMAKAVGDDNFSLLAMADFVDEVVEGFDDVKHDGSKEDLREYMLDDPAIVTAMYLAYSDAVMGRVQEKNSEPPRDASSASAASTSNA